jgi:hypothetical protein
VAVAVGVKVEVAVGVGPIAPFPLSSRCWGLFCAVSVNVRPFFAFIFPGLVGLNATETVQEPLAAIEPPQVSLVWTNGGATRMSVIVIAVVVDLLVTVTACGSLTRPTITFPKPIALGERTSLGTSALACISSADCANTGRTNTVSINNSEKVRAASLRGTVLERARSDPMWRNDGPFGSGRDGALTTSRRLPRWSVARRCVKCQSTDVPNKPSSITQRRAACPKKCLQSV